MTIPFLDLVRLQDSIRPEIDAALARVIDSAGYIGGAEVSAFEEEFGAAHGLARGAGCGSGTDALALALRALGVGPGDEVVVPAMTFVATAEAVAHVGATPVVADVNPVSLLLDEPSVSAVRTIRTRAVIAVHLYGHVVPFPSIEKWRSQGLAVIEDAAQAHLAHDSGRPIGSVSDAACFSFFPGKNLGGFGDGGMVLSRDPEVAAEVRRLRDHGRTSKYLHDVVGWCSRLDALQAAVLRAKLPHLQAWTDQRRALAERYRQLLPDGTLVPWQSGAVHHLLVARLADRDAAAARLRDSGIGTGIHYPVALSRQPWLEELGAAPAPAAEQAATEILSLPIDPLMTLDEVDHVCEQLTGALVGS